MLESDLVDMETYHLLEAHETAWTSSPELFWSSYPSGSYLPENSLAQSDSMLSPTINIARYYLRAERMDS